VDAAILGSVPHGGQGLKGVEQNWNDSLPNFPVLSLGHLNKVVIRDERDTETLVARGLRARLQTTPTAALSLFRRGPISCIGLRKLLTWL
jgi:hypothetical protein